MITPLKIQKLKIKKRTVIEYANLNIKRYDRTNTNTIKVVNVNTFMSCVYISSSSTNIIINKKYS
jgi:hypothetical protein